MKDNDIDRLLLQRIWEHLDGTLTPESLAQLNEQLATNPNVADLFVQSAELEGLLDQFHAGERIEIEARQLLSAIGLASGQSDTLLVSRSTDRGVEEKQPAPSIFSFVRATSIGMWSTGVLAALLLIVLGVGVLAWRGGAQPGKPAIHVATVAASTNALWSGSSVPDSEGWLPEGSVRLNRGQAEIRFVSGVIVVLKAPAEFQALSAIEANLKHGSITARVDGKATSFKIHTPTAKVVDLGTEFGISVADSGETDVAVFDGIVDVSSDPNGQSQRAEQPNDGTAKAPPRRMTAGEALRVDWAGQFRRIVTVTDDSFPALARPREIENTPRTPLIANVSDTLSNGDHNPKFYRIVSQGFGEDVPAYVDRSYEWNGIDRGGIPDFLLGADYIMPFNDDKWVEPFEMTITVTHPVTIYLLFDDRGPAPAWLQESFVDTGFDVGLDEGSLPTRPSRRLGKGAGDSIDNVFSVWKRDVSTIEPIVLGPRGGSSKTRRAMYGIVVTPLDSNVK